MSSRFTRSVFCYWCWKCCAEAIDKKVFSPRRLELRTLGVWGTRDNHYTMVLLKISRLSSLGWFCNMLVVDVNAVSSNVCPQQRRSLLSIRALITGQVLWKFTFYCPDASALLFLALFRVVLRLQLWLLELACWDEVKILKALWQCRCKMET